MSEIRCLPHSNKIILDTTHYLWICYREIKEDNTKWKNDIDGDKIFIEVNNIKDAKGSEKYYQYK